MTFPIPYHAWLCSKDYGNFCQILLFADKLVERILFLPQGVYVSDDVYILKASKWGKALLHYLNGKKVEIPHYSMGTTPFLTNVYNNLYNIPYGHTLTYQELATISGKPNAARAVGNAMRNNELPLIYPCHRVIGKDGGLHGFGGKGEDFLHIKRVLLTIEKQGSEITFL